MPRREKQKKNFTTTNIWNVHDNILKLMIVRRGKANGHSYAVASRIPDHNRKRVKLQIFIRKYREFLCGVFTLLILVLLHWNSGTQSKLDSLYIFTCAESKRLQRCSLIYGCLESVIFASLLIGAYYICFWSYFRIRYHLKSSDFLAGIDAYIIALPWLLSPLLRWHSITSLLMDGTQLFDGLFFYEYPESIEATDSLTRNLLDELNVESDHILNDIDDVESVNVPSYELAAYPILLSAVIRTLWSFLLWTGMDLFLWNNKSLLWLFEHGPNSAILSLRSEHIRSMYHLLLPHFDGIHDVTKLCLQFIDDEAPFILMEIKQNILESLRATDLSESYKVFSVVVAVVSAFRLWYCPSVGYVLSPVFFVLGIVIFVLMVIISIANGDFRMTPGAHNCDYASFVFIGVFCTALLWGFIIWTCMLNRLERLKQIQINSNVRSRHEDFTQDFLFSIRQI